MLCAAGKRLLVGAAGTRPFAGAGGSSVVAGRRGYHERVVDHYSNPRNVGAFDKEDGTSARASSARPPAGTS
ncbi:hypothetical protein ACQ4PT_030410 [Festuca glaucescens]